MALIGIITDIGVSKSIEASENNGFEILPTSFGVSDTAGALDPTRTAANSGLWYTGTISSRVVVDPHTVKFICTVPVGQIPPNTTKLANEIYIYCLDNSLVPFLFAIGQPSTPITYDPSGSTTFELQVTMINVNLSSFITFAYTQATELSEHNTDPNAHPEMMAALNRAGNFLPDGFGGEAFAYRGQSYDEKAEWYGVKASATHGGVLFTADHTGPAGNSIALVFNGTATTDAVINTWNNANPYNTVSHNGTGTEVLTATTLTLTGGTLNVAHNEFVYQDTDGYYKKALADGSIKERVAGIADLNGQIPRIVRSSGFVTITTGANPVGTVLYLSATVAGGVTAIPTSTRVGMVVAPNLVLVGIQDLSSVGVNADAIVTDSLGYHRYTTTQAAINAVSNGSTIMVDKYEEVITTLTTSGKQLNFVFNGPETGWIKNPGYSEIQKVDFSAIPTSGTYRFEWNAQETSDLAYNATNTDVQTAFNLLTGHAGVVVTGDFSSGFTITYNGVGAYPLPTFLNAGQSEIQYFSFSTVPDNGSFRFLFNGNYSTYLAFNATAANIQTALEAVTGIGVGNVLVTGSFAAGFTVTFQGTMVLQPVNQITTSDNTLQTGVTAVTIIDATTQEGKYPASNLKIGASSVTISVTEQQIGSIVGPATAITLSANACSFTGFGKLDDFTTGIDFNNTKNHRIEMYFDPVITTPINYGNSIPGYDFSTDGSIGIEITEKFETVDIIDIEKTTLPTGASVTLDGYTLQNNDTVIFTQPPIAGVYLVSGVGVAVTFTAHPLFRGSNIPEYGDTIKTTKNTTSYLLNYWLYTASWGWKHLDHTDIQSEPTGFFDRTSTSISFIDVSRTLSVTPIGDHFDVVQQGRIFRFSAAQSYVIPDVEGTYFFYFDNGVLTATPTFSTAIIKQYVFVASVYWDATNNTAIMVGEERHGHKMDGDTHRYLHSSVGTRYVSGLSAGDYTISGTGDANADAQLSVTGGVLFDEDIELTITHSATPTAPFEQILATAAQIPIYYRSGASGDWRRYTTTTYPVHKGSVRATYNDPAGPWSVADVPANNSFVAMWLFATNNFNEPIIAIMGQREDTTLNNALANNTYESLSFGVLPSLEMKVLYRLIFQTSSVYTNAVASKLVDIRDLRRAVDVSLGAYAPSDHGLLTGLSDMDHSASSIYTGATSGGVPSYIGGLSTSDIEVASALEDLDLLLGQLRIKTNATYPKRVNVTTSDLSLNDGSNLVESINSLIMNFSGAQLDFSNGNVYDTDGTTIIGTFTNVTPAATQWRHMLISIAAGSVDGTNRYPITFTVTAAATDGASKTTAVRPSFPTTGTPIGVVAVQEQSGTIKNIAMADVYQLAPGSGGAASNIFANNAGIKSTVLKAYDANIAALQMFDFGSVYADSTSSKIGLTQNAYYSAAAWKRNESDLSGRIQLDSGTLTYSNAVTGAADSNITWLDRFSIDANGNTGLTTLPHTNAHATYRTLDLGAYNSVGFSGSAGGVDFGSGMYFNGTNWVFASTSVDAWRLSTSSSGFIFYYGGNGNAGNNASALTKLQVTSGGITVTGTATISSNLVVNTNTIVTDTNKNIGLSTTPVTNTTGTIRNFELGPLNDISFDTANGNANFMSNLAYRDTTGWTHSSTAGATLLQVGKTSITMMTAPSGTGGTSASLSTKFQLDLNGNIGLSTTPHTNTQATWRNLDLGPYASILFQTTTAATELDYFNNAYYNGTAIVYSSTNKATNIQQYNGTISLQTAPNGTVDTGVSFNAKLFVDNNGNIGLSTIPHTNTHATVRNLDLGGLAALTFSSGNDVHVISNATYRTDNWYYNSTAVASRLTQLDGALTFYTAPSGTVDTAVTWSSRLGITNDGIINPYSATGRTAITSGINTTETVLKTRYIANQMLTPGESWSFALFGACTSTAANQSTFRVRFGTTGTTSDTLIAIFQVTAAASGTNIPFSAFGKITVRATGNGTTELVISMSVFNNATIGISTSTVNLFTSYSATSLNSTGNNYITVTYVSAAATTTSTFDDCVIEKCL